MAGRPESAWVMWGGTRVWQPPKALGAPSPLPHWITALYSGNTVDVLVLCCFFLPYMPLKNVYGAYIALLSGNATKKKKKKKMKCQEVVGGRGNPGLKCRAYERRRVHFPKVRAGFGESIFPTGRLLRSMIRGRGPRWIFDFCRFWSSFSFIFHMLTVCHLYRNSCCPRRCQGSLQTLVPLQILVMTTTSDRKRAKRT